MPKAALTWASGAISLDVFYFQAQSGEEWNRRRGVRDDSRGMELWDLPHLCVYF